MRDWQTKAPTVAERMVEPLTAALQALTKVRVEHLTLHPCRGYWTHVKQDVMAWQGYADLTSSRGGDASVTLTVSIGSWDSLTECERRGFELHDCRGKARTEVDIEVLAKPRGKP